MILIVSQLGDYATTQVENWLLFYNKKFIRINGDGTYHIKEVTTDRFIIEMDNHLYNLYDCDSYWYRRDGISMYNFNVDMKRLLTRSDILDCIKRSVKDEYTVIKNHIYKQLERHIGANKCIGTYETRSVNKLDVLVEAKELGLCIPQTTILSFKKDLMKWLSKEKIITKASSECIFESDQKNYYISYTSALDADKVSKLPEKFMPSLFQEQINKSYELRIFYLRGKLYPSAIFSQNDPKGEIDCRRSKEFRYLPYKLPKDISLKLCRLMRRIGLNTGSIDMIVDTNNNYIFLEVNPVGQFVAYGEFCNYYLDRKLAKAL